MCRYRDPCRHFPLSLSPSPSSHSLCVSYSSSRFVQYCWETQARLNMVLMDSLLELESMSMVEGESHTVRTVSLSLGPQISTCSQCHSSALVPWPSTWPLPKMPLCPPLCPPSPILSHLLTLLITFLLISSENKNSPQALPPTPSIKPGGTQAPLPFFLCMGPIPSGPQGLCSYYNLSEASLSLISFL